MGEKKTLAAALVAAAVWSASFASAEHVPKAAEARLLVFAECAGRFSAQMEHAWLLGVDGHISEARRRHMVTLIDAIGPQPGVTAQDILAFRIEAKMAHAALLTRVTFGQEARARGLAARYIARCAALLPGPRDLVSL